MKKTKIEWCDSTWNPVTGCLHRCEYCYARRIAERFSTENKNHAFTDGHPIGKIHDLENPAIVIETGKKSPYPFGFEPTFHRYKLDEPQRWAKSKNIFVCSMADLFGEWVPDEWIGEVLAACDEAPQHNYLFLTKNPKRYEKFLNRYTPDNMWFGWSQTEPSREGLNISVHHSVHTFVSIEPLFKPFEKITLQGIDWVIIGAETGNRKGKIIPEKAWIDEIVGFCDSYKTPVFMKNSLIPIMGEENMRREFPWETATKKEAGKATAKTAAQDVLQSAT